MKKPKQERPQDAIIELLESLPRVAASHEGPYTFTDRASDFIAVFSTEQGRRVLAQIHTICDPAPKFEDADKPGTLAMKSGMRRVMAEIMYCFVAKKPLTIESAPKESLPNG